MVSVPDGQRIGAGSAKGGDGKPGGPQDLCKEIPEPIGPANILQGSQRFILRTVEPLETKQKGISGTESRYGP